MTSQRSLGTKISIIATSIAALAASILVPMKLGHNDVAYKGHVYKELKKDLIKDQEQKHATGDESSQNSKELNSPTVLPNDEVGDHAYSELHLARAKRSLATNNAGLNNHLDGLKK